MSMENSESASREQDGDARVSFSETTSHPALDDDPRLSNPYCQLIRELHAALKTAIESAGLTQGQRVLDYGCATMRYRKLIPDGVEYVGADLVGNELADVLLRDDGRLPLDDASFDLVLSTQVLEHVEDPALYLAECRRVLKPGGQLILSTHGVHVYHPCPSDYWRWTRTGLELAIGNAGLSVNATHGVLGGIPAALQFLQELTVKRLPRLFQSPLTVVFQALIKLSDRRYTPASRTRNGCILVCIASAK